MPKDSLALLFDSFAALLEYPALDFNAQAREGLTQLHSVHSEAAELLEKFVNDMEEHSLQWRQELYTTIFDMQPVCYPYVGYHLFGESYKRGAFMAQLNEAYHAIGYSAGQELPDHLSVILRFLGSGAAHQQDEFGGALIEDGVMPALEKMLKVFGAESGNPYFALLSALHLFLVHLPEKELSHG